jgi:hypothetical protein
MLGGRSGGSVKAKSQKTFLILASKPELVVLRIYGNDYICYEFDRVSKKIKNSLYIKTQSAIADEGVPIREEEIGPLSPTKQVKPVNTEGPKEKQTPTFKEATGPGPKAAGDKEAASINGK